VHYKDLSENIKIGTGETLGKIYRASSVVAPHIVQLTLSGVKKQLIDMTTDPQGLNLKDVPMAVYDRMAQVVHGNIKADLEKNFKWSSSTQSFYISGSNNNFNIIRQAFSAAFGSKKAYGPFFDFIIKQLQQDKNKNTDALAAEVETYRSNLLGGITGTAQEIEEETNRRLKGYGFDVGHLEANVTAAFKTAMWNEIKESVKDGNLIDFNNDPVAAEIIAKDLERLQDEWIKLLVNPVGAKTLFNQLKRFGVIKSGQEGAGIITGFFNHTIGFIREVLNRNIKATVVVESYMEDDSAFERVAREAAISIIPEYAKFNQDKGSKLEQAIVNHLKMEAKGADKKLITYLNNWLEGKGGGPPLLMTPGSPAIFDMLGNKIYEDLQLGKSKNVFHSGTASKKASNTVGKGTPAKLGKTQNIGFGDIGGSNRISLGIGPKIAKPRQLNIINIVNMINQRLAETIRASMGSPKLNYRTGRFADSVKVLGGSMDKDGSLRLPYTYMKYPYQTFEPGFARGTKERDPKVLISESIKELAIKLVLIKLRVVRV
jgi:hypothetical protein